MSIRHAGYGLVIGAFIAAWHPAAGAAPSYDAEIAPILRTYCSGCHNDREAEAGFSVERYAALRKGGDDAGDPIIAGDPQVSGLIRRILSTGADHMHPADEPQVRAGDRPTVEAWSAAGGAGAAADG
ncbi:MAG: c-type cytochrome domain-containing protein, partial [Planctomycetia bacterium]